MAVAHEIRPMGTDSHGFDRFTVAGTRFAFRTLPEREDTTPTVFEKAVAHRATILDKASGMTFTRPRTTRRRPRPPVPGTGEFTAKPGDPGSLIEVDGQLCEVWAQARTPSQRWVTRDEDYVLVDKAGHVHATLGPGQQRTLVVQAVSDRAASAIASTQAPDPGCSPPPGDTDRYRHWLAAAQRRTEAMDWARARIAHELYPDHYPAPTWPTTQTLVADA